MSEMELLHEMLTEEGIEHTYAPRNLSISEMVIDLMPVYNGADDPVYFEMPAKLAGANDMQVIIYDQNHKRLLDAVCGYGTYGYEQGLLEVMGTIVPEKDGVIGWLTAQDVMGLVHSAVESGAVK